MAELMAVDHSAPWTEMEIVELQARLSAEGKTFGGLSSYQRELKLSKQRSANNYMKLCAQVLGSRSAR